MTKKNTSTRRKQAKRVTINLPFKLHREMTIAAAHRNETMISVVQRAWDCFKEQQGDRLNEPAEQES